MSTRTFRARYDGECMACGFSFDQDDPIGYDQDDSLRHAHCLDDEAADGITDLTDLLGGAQ